MVKNKLIISSVLALAIALLMMVSITFAWFYFPSSKNLIINTPSQLDIQIDLYHLEESGDSYRFNKVNNINNGVISIDTSLVFFHYGGEYICESNKDDYYAIVASYDSNEFSTDANIKALINATLECTSLFNYEVRNGDTTSTVNLRFPLVSVGYSIAPQNSVNLTQAAGTTAARNAEYTAINLQGEDDQSNASLVLTGTEELLFTTLNSNQYVERYTDENNLSTTRIKVIIFVKVTANEEYVNDIMLGIDTNLGSELAIIINNSLTLSTNLRTIPLHTPAN